MPWCYYCCLLASLLRNSDICVRPPDQEKNDCSLSLLSAAQARTATTASIMPGTSLKTTMTTVQNYALRSGRLVSGRVPWTALLHIHKNQCTGNIDSCKTGQPCLLHKQRRRDNIMVQVIRKSQCRTSRHGEYNARVLQAWNCER